MIYFTKNGETADQIAANFASHNDASLTNKIVEINRQTFANSMFPQSAIYAGNRAIWIPEENDPEPRVRNEILRRLDWLETNERDNLIQLSQHDIHYKTAKNAKMFAGVLSMSLAEKLPSEFGWFKERSLEWGYSLGKLRFEHFDAVKNAFDQVTEKLIEYKNAGAHLTDTLRNETKALYRTALADCNSVLEELDISNRAVFKSWTQLKGMIHHRKHIMNIFNLSELEDAIDVARCGKFIAGGLYWLYTIPHDVIEEVHAIKNHGHWFKLLAKDLAEVGFFFVAAAVAGFLFASGGWVVILAGATAETIVNVAADAVIEKSLGIN